MGDEVDQLWTELGTIALIVGYRPADGGELGPSDLEPLREHIGRRLTALHEQRIAMRVMIARLAERLRRALRRRRA